jgi:hypothetical protein
MRAIRQRETATAAPLQTAAVQVSSLLSGSARACGGAKLSGGCLSHQRGSVRGGWLPGRTRRSCRRGRRLWPLQVSRPATHVLVNTLPWPCSQNSHLSTRKLFPIEELARKREVFVDTHNQRLLEVALARDGSHLARDPNARRQTGCCSGQRRTVSAVAARPAASVALPAAARPGCSAIRLSSVWSWFGPLARRALMSTARRCGEDWIVGGAVKRYQTLGESLHRASSQEASRIRPSDLLLRLSL